VLNSLFCYLLWLEPLIQLHERLSVLNSLLLITLEDEQLTQHQPGFHKHTTIGGQKALKLGWKQQNVHYIYRGGVHSEVVFIWSQKLGEPRQCQWRILLLLEKTYCKVVSEITLNCKIDPRVIWLVIQSNTGAIVFIQKNTGEAQWQPQKLQWTLRQQNSVSV